MTKAAEIKFEIALNLPQKTNAELLQTVLFLAGGDDYDGCFTEEGQIEYDASLSELKNRLIKIGFLNE